MCTYSIVYLGNRGVLSSDFRKGRDGGEGPKKEKRMHK